MYLDNFLDETLRNHVNMYRTRASNASELDNFEPSYEVRKIDHARKHRMLYGKVGTEAAAIDFRLLEKDVKAEPFRAFAWSRRDMNSTRDRHARDVASMVDTGVQTPVGKKTVKYASYQDKVETYEQMESIRVPCLLQRKRKVPCEILMLFRELRRNVSDMTILSHIQDTNADTALREGIETLTREIRKGIFTDEGEWLFHERIQDTTFQMLKSTTAADKQSMSPRMLEIYTEITMTAEDLTHEARDQNESI